MKYLVLLTPRADKTPDAFSSRMNAEVNAVWAACASGGLREFYASQSPTVITLIYELADLAAVNDELAKLPMVQAGLLDQQIIQLGPFLQLQTLFEKNPAATA